MADAPEATEDSRPQPGESIAKRLFSRGATRASVGSRAEFYHRLGVDDPYAVEAGESEPEGPFTYLSSSAYYRDLRRSRLGLISRLSSGERRIGRVEQRSRRIGPAAMATRPSSLARFMATDAEFELLDDPVLLARAEEEEGEGFRWPRTKPRARREVGPKARPMEAAVQREIVEVAAGADELQRMIARVLQTVRGPQRERLLALLGEVQASPERSRRAAVRSAVRKLRGPGASGTRAEMLASEEASTFGAAHIAESRGTLTGSKGLRPALRRSPSILTWLEPQEEELAEGATQPTARRRRPTPVSARPSRPTRPSSDPAEAPSTSATAALVQRILQAESAASDGGTVSAQPTRGVRLAGRRTLAGRVSDGDASAPLARAATGYLREAPTQRRARGSRLRPVEMAFAEQDVVVEPGEAAVAPGRRRPASVRAAERAVPVAGGRRMPPSAEAAATRSPLGSAPVRAASDARRGARPVADGTRAGSMVPRPVRRRAGRSVIDNALFALADDAQAAEEAVAPTPRRRQRTAAAEPTGARTRGAAAAPLAAAPARIGTVGRVSAEPASVRAARRGVVGAQGDTVLSSSARRRRRLAPVPTAYLEASSEEVVAAVTGAEGGAARRLRRAVVEQAIASETATARVRAGVAERDATPRAARSSLRPTLATRTDAEVAEPTIESSMVRAARRGVVDGSGDALVAEPRRRRGIAPVPTAYLDASTDDVVDSVLGEAPARRRRAALAQAPAEAPAPVAADASGAPVQGVSERAAARGEGPAAEEDRPTVRAARRAADVPQRRRAASVLAVPTAYLTSEPDEVAEEAAPLAPRRRRDRAVAVSAEVGAAGELVAAVGSPAQRILRRDTASTDAPSSDAIEAANRRSDAPDNASPRTVAARGLRADAMQLVASETPEVVDEAPAPRPRPSVRAVARTEVGPRRDRRGRVLLGTTTPDLPRAGRRRASAPMVAAPSARMLARGEDPGTMPRRSTVRRPVPSFSLGMVLPELLDALADADADEIAAPRARRALGRATDPAADTPVDAFRLGLEEVARRTSNAVRALDRTDRSVLTFDAARRTFGDESTLAAARRAPTVEARVDVDAQGRVLRVRATRLATGEQVLLQGDEVLPVEQAVAAPQRRPAPSEWAEERAAVGMARGASDASVVREAPGARLVERSAVPDVRMRSGVGRSIRPLGLDLLAPMPFDAAEGDAAAPAVGRRRSPGAPGPTLGAAGRMDSELGVDERTPLAQRRSRLVPGLGPITLAAADGTDTSEAEVSSVPGARRRRRGPVLPPVGRAAARRAGADRSLGGTLARLSEPGAAGEVSLPTGRRLRRHDEPELAWLDADDSEGLDDSVGEAPSWARRAGRPSIGDRKLPDIFSKPRVRTSGGLLTALARAGDPEEVVRVILQRSGDLGDASMLAPAAQRLLHRVVDEAGVVARRAGRSDRAMRGSTTVAPQSKTVVTNMLDPFGPGGFDGSGARSSAVSSQGMGASKVMKLANKLMKLIHLAENDGRGDAHKHVRMAENSSEARAESGAGATSGEQFDEKTMNIKALRQDVLDAVLRALEDLRWRREDPDGPSFWC